MKLAMFLLAGVLGLAPAVASADDLPPGAPDDGGDYYRPDGPPGAALPAPPPSAQWQGQDQWQGQPGPRGPRGPRGQRGMRGQRGQRGQRGMNAMNGMDPQLRAALIQRFDANGDGRLEGRERRQAARALRRMAKRLSRRARRQQLPQMQPAP